MKLKFCWNQWIVGLMYDEGRILPVRWLIVHVGPLSIAFNIGRGERHLLPR